MQRVSITLIAVAWKEFVEKVQFLALVCKKLVHQVQFLTL